MKLTSPKLKFKPNLSLIINSVLILVFLSEVYFVYSLLYKKLNPQPTEVVNNKIVKVDLKAYRDTTDLIKSRRDFVPNVLDLKNLNPFKYSQ